MMKRVSVSLSDEVYLRVVTAAERERRSVSKVIALLLEEFYFPAGYGREIPQGGADRAELFKRRTQ